jgi:hypothetical protein
MFFSKVGLAVSMNPLKIKKYLFLSFLQSFAIFCKTGTVILLLANTQFVKKISGKAFF